jgi:hypothetical protein
MADGSDPDGARDLRPPALPSAFEAFVVETETMADGRLIHYYRWPADDEAVHEATPADV